MQYLLKSLIVYNLMDFWKEFIKHFLQIPLNFLLFEKFQNFLKIYYKLFNVI